MVIDWIDIILKAFWCGVAAIGFAVLFNSPMRALLSIFLCGFLAGFIKFAILGTSGGENIILSSAAAAAALGFASIPVSHLRHVPPMVISIPPVIPLVPGYFAYETMLGLMTFIYDTRMDLLIQIIYNGLMTFFIILVLSLGVTLPMILFRIESVKKVKFSISDWKKTE